MRSDLRFKLLPAFAFAGAFLMFVLEPLVGRLLLPAYGGGFHVWTTCLMFFQGVLLAGYVYAHFVAPRIGRWHLLVACLPLALLPVGVSADPDPNAPVLSILTALAARIALPIGVLSTTGVIAQTWLARSRSEERGDPYWLYAASNAGSLLGLLAYPLLVEPFLGVATQRALWSVLYVGYVTLAAAIAPRACEQTAPVMAAVVPDGSTGRSRGGREAAWLALSAAPSIMLMAVTNALSFDVGSIPLVWVAPLALYLTTFILVFGKRPLYPRALRAYWPEIAIAGLVVLAAAPLFPSWPRLAIHLLALFAVCMAGHAELHRLRPPASELTKYYLVISVGGWAGGVFVSLAAPALFERLFEYPVAIALLAATLAFTRRTQAPTSEAAEDAVVPFASGGRLQLAVRAPVAVTALAFAGAWMLPSSGSSDVRLLLMRNHYGIYQVGELPHETGDGEQLTVRAIVHNGTIHGTQITDEGRRRDAIGYYHPATGLGDVMRTIARPMRLGVIGLGAGGTTAHVGAGDEIVFYEIDPDGETIARKWFTYLDECPGTARVVIGDARVQLAADAGAPDGHFDVFLVDAFNGDAIPTHLMTLEAIELYRRKVRPGGLLVFHITNRFYDLRPVLEASRQELGMHAAYKTRQETDLEPLERRTRYWVMSHDPVAIDDLVARGWTRAGAPPISPARVWTDDYVNVLAPLWAQLSAPAS